MRLTGVAHVTLINYYWLQATFSTVNILKISTQLKRTNAAEQNSGTRM